MKQEVIHFSLIVGTILLIMGAFSLIYGFIIPTQSFPMNDPPSILFKTMGVFFIIVGLLLVFFLRKRQTFQTIETEEDGIDA